MIPMKIHRVLLLFSLFISAWASAQMPPARVIRRPLVRQISAGLAIDSVRLSPKGTTLYVSCSNHEFRPVALVRTAPPGHNDALRLIANRAFFQLVAVEGLPTSGKSHELLYGDTMRFLLHFEALPPACTAFDMVEGAADVSHAWMAFGVQLNWSMKSGLSANGGWPFQSRTDFEAYWRDNAARQWEVEGYAILTQRWTNKRGTVALRPSRVDTVAVVQAWNRFYCFTMHGEPLALTLKHFRKQRYTLYTDARLIGTRSRAQLREGTRFRIPRRQVSAIAEEEASGRWFWWVKLE